MTTNDKTRYPYQDASLPVMERVTDLLSRMTIDEKIAQLHAAWLKLSVDGQHRLRVEGFSQTDKDISVDKLLAHGIGQITRPLGTHQVEPKEGIEAFNTLQRTMVEQTRLGIPVMAHEECLVGLMIDGATLLPSPLNYAATWNPALIHEVGESIGEECRSIGSHQGLAPVLDVSRDPRWGRTEETLGEDPYLVGLLGTEYVKGLQGEKRDLIATLKHFAGHSASEGGRNHAPVHLGRKELNDIFLLPFEMAIKLGHAGAVMPAYHDIDGVPCHADHWLLTTVLREKWGFKGIIVADYAGVNLLFAHHGIARNQAHAAALSFNAGLDIELPGHECTVHLKEALESGEITMETIDRAVMRILRTKFELGLFEAPYANSDKVNIQSDKSRQLARQVALQSMTLLRNDGILPLRPDDKRKIAIIGPTANDPLALLGGYSFPVHLINNGEYNNVPISTPLEAMRKVYGEDRILYAKGCDIITERTPGAPVFPGDVNQDASVNHDKASLLSQDTGGIAAAVQTAQAAEVAIVFVGDLAGLFQSGTVGEGSDTDSLMLPGVQQQLLDAIAASGVPTVVVQTGGRPYTLNGLERQVSAHIMGYFGGQEVAPALAALISGKENFSGRLPLSIPKSAGAIPYVYNHKLKSGGTPIADHFGAIYSFGHGLSYTTFDYTDYEVEQNEVDIESGTLDFAFKVSNTGNVDGTEVVQIYVRDRMASLVRPLKELKAFGRINLAAGETARVEVKIPTDMLNFTDERGERIVEPGQFEVMIGRSSEDICLHDMFRITGKSVRTLPREWRMTHQLNVVRP